MNLLREYIRSLLEEVELTLSTKGLDPTPGLTAFMDAYEKLTHPRPFVGMPGDRLWLMGEIDGNYCIVTTNIKIDKYRNMIHFSSIQTVGDDLRSSPTDVCEGHGFASKVMNKITALADKHQVPIKLQAISFGQKSMTEENLVAWYKRAGFEQQDPYWNPDGLMVRQPR